MIRSRCRSPTAIRARPLSARSSVLLVNAFYFVGNLRDDLHRRAATSAGVAQNATTSSPQSSSQPGQFSSLGVRETNKRDYGQGGNMASTLITGLGLVGTSYAQHAIKRGESVVFYDIAPRKDFLAHKL